MLSPETIAELRNHIQILDAYDSFSLKRNDAAELLDAYESVEKYKACADEAVRMLNAECIRAAAAEEKMAEYKRMLVLSINQWHYAQIIESLELARGFALTNSVSTEIDRTMKKLWEEKASQLLAVINNLQEQWWAKHREPDGIG